MRRNPAVIGLVTARGGSKGIPGKNIRLVAGKPLIAHTIEAAKASRRLDRVIVSTDDDAIARVALQWGAEVPFRRPAELAGDTSSHLDVLLHAAQWWEDHGGHGDDYLVTLQPTSPLRLPADIDGAVELALSREAEAVVGVGPALAHPYMTKRIDERGVMISFITNDLNYMRRQDFPPAYIINGAVYVNRIAAIRRDRTMFPAETLAYIMPESRSLDIDTPLDLTLCELMLRDAHHAKKAA